MKYKYRIIQNGLGDYYIQEKRGIFDTFSRIGISGFKTKEEAIQRLEWIIKSDKEDQERKTLSKKYEIVYEKEIEL